MTKTKIPEHFEISPEYASELATAYQMHTPSRRAHFESRRRELEDWIAHNGRAPRDRADGAAPAEHMMRIRYVILSAAGVEIAA